MAEEHFVEAPLGGPQLEINSIRNTLFLWDFLNDLKNFGFFNFNFFVLTVSYIKTIHKMAQKLARIN